MSTYDVTATITSFRTPSTACAYHSGKVSLSPLVMITAYGSAEFRRSTAQSRVKVSPRRDAWLALVKRGMSAMASSGDAMIQLLSRGSSSTRSPFSRCPAPLNRLAAPCQSAVHTLQAENVQTKK